MNAMNNRPLVVRSTKAHELLGIGRTRLFELSKRADFPRKVKLGGKASGFVVAELEAWVREHADRDAS
jgi:predicted DNA-binding transcriptional regulator AlpA